MLFPKTVSEVKRIDFLSKPFYLFEEKWNYLLYVYEVLGCAWPFPGSFPIFPFKTAIRGVGNFPAVSTRAEHFFNVMCANDFHVPYSANCLPVGRSFKFPSLSPTYKNVFTYIELVEFWNWQVTKFLLKLFKNYTSFGASPSSTLKIIKYPYSIV